MNDRDLFGKKVKKKRTRVEILLMKQDRDTLQVRMERIKYIQHLVPSRMGLLGSLESVFMFGEAQATFINGQWIATLLLAQAFIERQIHNHMLAKGYQGADRGLKYMLKYCRTHSILSESVLDKIDHLRSIRNPFTHLKPIDYPFNLGSRIFQGQNKGPKEVLESDAKQALSLMVTILFAKMR
jgi:hypothetical protein